MKSHIETNVQYLLSLSELSMGREELKSVHRYLSPADKKNRNRLRAEVRKLDDRNHAATHATRVDSDCGYLRRHALYESALGAAGAVHHAVRAAEECGRYDL